MSIFGRILPWWLPYAIIAALIFALMGQQVRVSNAKARTSRAETALSNYRTEVAETARQQQAKEDAKAIQQRNRELEALNAAKLREAALGKDAAGARSALERLRGAIRVAASRDPVPGPSADPGTEPTPASAKLLAQCAAEYQALGERADGHASDVQTLTESWPK